MKTPPLLYLDTLPGGPESGTFILNLEDLPDHGGKDILFEDGRFRVNIFVQRYDGTVYVYENRCPHAGTPLNLMNDRFINIDNSSLICRTHGALFNPHSGYCTHGPCKKKHLRKVAFEEKKGALYTV